MVTRVLPALGMTALLGFAQPAAEDIWAPLRFLIGKWEGQSKGKPGTGAATREYEFELRNRYIVGSSRAVYPPREGRTEPEIHEDRSVFSFDRSAKKFILRQFHVEGFVNEYELSNASADQKMLEFTTRRIENIAEGWRARESYQILGPGELRETFSLAPPGKDFEVYSESRLKRVR